MNSDELSSRIDDLDKRVKALEQWLDNLNEGLLKMQAEYSEADKKVLEDLRASKFIY